MGDLAIAKFAEVGASMAFSGQYCCPSGLIDSCWHLSRRRCTLRRCCASSTESACARLDVLKVHRPAAVSASCRITSRSRFVREGDSTARVRCRIEAILSVLRSGAMPLRLPRAPAAPMTSATLESVARLPRFCWQVLTADVLECRRGRRITPPCREHHMPIRQCRLR